MKISEIENCSDLIKWVGEWHPGVNTCKQLTGNGESGDGWLNCFYVCEMNNYLMIDFDKSGHSFNLWWLINTDKEKKEEYMEVFKEWTFVGENSNYDDVFQVMYINDELIISNPEVYEVDLKDLLDKLLRLVISYDWLSETYPDQKNINGILNNTINSLVKTIEVKIGNNNSTTYKFKLKKIINKLINIDINPKKSL